MLYINSKPIAILMGTYNGQDFIAEQLDSIISQTNQNWNLYIRDDGSTDNTVSILKKYTETYNNIFLIEDNLGNLWCKNNFFRLLEYVKSDYYMFCDQDDVWLSSKINDTFQQLYQIEKDNPDTPVVIYTDLKVVDENLNLISNSFWENVKIRPNILTSFEYLAVYNAGWGCTLMFNNLAKEISIPMTSNAMMHDNFLCLNVVCKGGIISYVNKSTILYRQHKKNTDGAQNYNKNYILNKLLNIKTVIRNNIEQYKMANDLKKFPFYKFIFYRILYTLKR